MIRRMIGHVNSIKFKSRNNYTIYMIDLSIEVSSFVQATAAETNSSFSWDGKVIGQGYEVLGVPRGKKIILQVRG